METALSSPISQAKETEHYQLVTVSLTLLPRLTEEFWDSKEESRIGYN